MTSSSQFGLLDYFLFGVMLSTSLGIGVYYACTGGKQKTTREFLLGDRQMGIIPVGFSLLASFMSAVALLGIPSEIYTFGTQYMFMMTGYVILIPLVAYLILPIYYNLNVVSIYEYLERRYNKRIRKIAALMFILQMCLYLSVVTYAPALALMHVMGLNLWISMGITISICTIYTTIGGMKAVMWTDVLQTIFMFVSVFVIMVKGCYDMGGIKKVWKINSENHRFEFFNYNFEPRTRHTIWTQSIGAVFTWLPVYGVNQAQVQRYMSAGSLPVAQKALWGNLFGLIWNCIVCSIIGLVIFARYHDCDPLSSKTIQSNDQLMPLYAMEVFSSLPGFMGLFVAGIFSGSLSTLSSGLNSLAAVTLEDFFKDTRWKNIKEERVAYITKIFAFTYGIICFLCAGLVAIFPNISQAALGLFSMSAPVLGVFLLGMFCPWTNSWGAAIGMMFGFIQILWLTAGALITKPPLPKLPVSVEGCNFSSSLFQDDLSFNISSSTFMPFNENGTTTNPINSNALLPLYSISYMWYGMITCLVAIISGLIGSFATGPQNVKVVDPKLLSPIVLNVCSYLSKRRKRLTGQTENVISQQEENKLEDNYTHLGLIRGQDVPLTNFPHFAEHLIKS